MVKENEKLKEISLNIFWHTPGSVGLSAGGSSVVSFVMTEGKVLASLANTPEVITSKAVYKPGSVLGTSPPSCFLAGPSRHWAGCLELLPGRGCAHPQATLCPCFSPVILSSALLRLTLLYIPKAMPYFFIFLTRFLDLIYSHLSRRPLCSSGLSWKARGGVLPTSLTGPVTWGR